MWKVLSLVLLLLSTSTVAAQDGDTPYRINPGDILNISVWQDENMTRTMAVLPDGSISYLLVGEIIAANRLPAEIKLEIEERLKEKKIYNDPVVSVSIIEPKGYQVYILGEVRSPGVYSMIRRIDALQALSLAGGLGQFADADNIKILRRSDGKQEVIKFNYSKVEKGSELESNIILGSGDTIIVPASTIF